MNGKKISAYKKGVRVALTAAALTTVLASSAILFRDQLNDSAYKLSTWRERSLATKIAKYDPLYKDYSPHSSSYCIAVGWGVSSVSGPSVDELNRTLNAYESGETSGIWKERRVLMRDQVIKKIKYVGRRSGNRYSW